MHEQLASVAFPGPRLSAVIGDNASLAPLAVPLTRGGPAGVRINGAGVIARITCANSVAAFRLCFACANFCFKYASIGLESNVPL